MTNLPEANLKFIIDNLEASRIKQGISTRELARRCGWSQTQVVVILNHKVNPRIDTLLTLAVALGYTLELKPFL